ncbi:3298_t:CDS:2, partial [Ambispora gerdemannii]
MELEILKTAHSNKLFHLYETSTFYDVSLIVGEPTVQKTFSAHKAILAAQSQFFVFALSSNNTAAADNNIKLPNITPRIFEILLRYFYCGVMELEEHYEPTILDILDAAKKLEVEELVHFIQIYLEKHNTLSLTEKTFVASQLKNNPNQGLLSRYKKGVGVWCVAKWGPAFGGGSDLCLFNSSNYCRKSSSYEPALYEKDAVNFDISEYE